MDRAAVNHYPTLTLVRIGRFRRRPPRTACTFFGRAAARLRGAARQHGHCTTLRMFLAKIEQQYGRARRWDHGSRYSDGSGAGRDRASDPPVRYLVGTPKGRLSRLEKPLLAKPWSRRGPCAVKLLEQDSELYVYAESADRVSKERAMRKRQLKWLWKRLADLAAMEISREEMLMKLGAARSRAPAACVWSRSRWTRKVPCLSTPSTARSFAVSAGARGVICCARTSPKTIPQCCGSTISSWSRWKRRSKS